MRHAVWFYLSIVVCAGACGDDAATMQADAAAADGGSDAQAGDPDALYASDHLLEVELTLDDADFQKLREEGRTLEQVFSGCQDDFAYTTFPAQAVIDGKKIGKIGARKKGYLGSLSTLRPSLHLDIAEFSPELRVSGQKTLVLNNSRQDASYAHTCMAYDVFRRAGVPASRCSFAHVVVNGEDLGTYVNVEPVKKPLLAEHFGDDSGNLYEGAGGADFRSDMLDGFEQKTNESMPSQAPMQRIIDALAKSGSARIAAIEKAVDLDAFMKFWATESLVSHWDGYSGDLNNFFIYERSSDGRVVFLPWGTDSAFEKNHAFLPEDGRPKSVFALARLARVLYEDPSTQERYRDTLREVIEDSWDEAAMADEIDRIAELVGDEASAAKLDEQRAFVRDRRAEMEQELDAAKAPAWTLPERPANTCRTDIATSASGTFKTQWGNIDDVAADPAIELTLELAGVPQTFTSLVAGAGNFTDMDTGAVTPAIRIIGFRPSGGFVLVQLSLGKRALEDGARVPLHGLESFGFVATGTSAADLTSSALISDGEILLDQAGTQAGDLVSGSFTGKAIAVALPVNM